jgi:hypothetical protein
MLPTADSRHIGLVDEQFQPLLEEISRNALETLAETLPKSTGLN